ncbi:alpha/beta hydrolase [Nitrosomonas sp. JL21]|uniref:alpha/beta fold hydrolase n=1 Tax=Nitrosomonas sp. JL21 TaxID=153949 RepID=UPI00136A0ED6|nr:alpha/beta fold hydrolase [Nitrosomonas sp. JL21]MBL8498524.1 alpha/beta hydrolase [Nitrosomonas sp.]MCC7092017.1 alpha/beta hydrolase [Nitrosomonas sp.]MXS77045.1 alpha/beta hydrolase [Nitrosomonas sp. JL21]
MKIVIFMCLAAALSLSGCAVMDKNTPGWAQYRIPDQSDDLRLASSSTGTGEPVLLIHGFGASSYSWRHVIAPLAQKYRVITIDLKGFGDSPKPRDDAYSVYEQARLVRNFILDNDLKNLHIVGHSYGGGVALAVSIYLAASNPELQKSLVLMDNIAYPQELPDFVKILATPILGPLLIHTLPDTFQVKDLLKKVYFNDDLIPQDAIDHYAADLGKPNAKYALLTTARQILPRDLQEFSNNYPNLRIPTLIVWSREDEIVPLAIGQRLHEHLPNSKLVVLSDVGHAVQEEKPALLLPHLQHFLDDQTQHHAAPRH